MHKGEVTNIIYDEKSKMVVTTGSDNSICVTQDIDGELVLMRSISSCHNGGICSLAYSHNLSLIVTGGSKFGEFRLWDFQRLSLKCVGESSSRDVHAIQIVEEYSMVIVGGFNGVADCWRYFFDGERQSHGLEFLCRLGGANFGMKVPQKTSHFVSCISVICNPEEKGGGEDEDGDNNKEEKNEAEPEPEPEIEAGAEAEAKNVNGTFSLTSTSAPETETVAPASHTGLGKYICVMDDLGVLTLFSFPGLLSLASRACPRFGQLPPSSYPSKDQDYIAELKLSRDMSVYLKNTPSPLPRPRSDMSATDTHTPTSKGERVMNHLPPAHSWSGHAASIVKGLAISHPPSLVSASADGFVAVWSPGGSLLGEMRLPNLDEQRRAERAMFHHPVKELDWNFPEVSGEDRIAQCLKQPLPYLT